MGNGIRSHKVKPKINFTHSESNHVGKSPCKYSVDHVDYNKIKATKRLRGILALFWESHFIFVQIKFMEKMLIKFPLIIIWHFFMPFIQKHKVK